MPAEVHGFALAPDEIYDPFNLPNVVGDLDLDRSDVQGRAAGVSS